MSSVDRPCFSQTPLWIHVAAMMIVILPCIAVSQFTAHLQAAILDDHLFAYFGWRIRHGAALYADVWDHKPPGMFWLDALGFLIGHGSYFGIVFLCTLAMLAAGVLFFLVASRVYHRGSAALATMLAGVYLTHGLFFAGGNRAETFLIPCELMLVLFYLWGLKRDRWGYWFAAGLFGGGALLFKQTGVAALAAVCIYTILLGLLKKLTVRQVWHRFGLILSGCCTVLILTAIYFAIRGLFAEVWFAVVTFNRLKLAHDYHDWLNPAWWRRWSDRYTLSVLRLPILMASAAILHAGLCRLRSRRFSLEHKRTSTDFAPAHSSGSIHMRWPARQGICHSHRSEGDAPHSHEPVERPTGYLLLFVFWFAIGWVGAVLSPSSSAHRFLPVLPPLLLISGYLIDVLKTELSLLDRLAQRAWVLVAFLLMAYLGWDAIYLNYQKAGMVYWERRPHIEQGHWVVTPTLWQQVGDEVAGLTQPEETIQCWDYTPQVYLRARRRNACRFVADWWGAMVPRGSVHIDQELFETLQSRPPKVVVISAARYEALCGTRQKTARRVSPMGRWLDTHFRRLKDLTRGNLYVLIRRSSAVGAGTRIPTLAGTRIPSPAGMRIPAGTRRDSRSSTIPQLGTDATGRWEPSPQNTG